MEDFILKASGAVSFLQVENKENSPKKQCGCKFIKSSDDFLQSNLDKIKKEDSKKENKIMI